MHQLPDLVPARMINEFCYCPRLCYLEWVQGQFVDNADTVEGRYQHRTVDQEDRDSFDPSTDGSVVTRSVLLSSPAQRLIARIDLLELTDGYAVPVEYKRGKLPDIVGGVWESDRVQLCTQGLILRAQGFRCESGIVYYVESKQRVEVPFDDLLVARTLELRDQLLEMAESQRIPEPLGDSPKCIRCSLAGICLPDEVNMLNLPNRKQELRRLMPARPDALPVYVQMQGAMVGKQNDELVIKKTGEVVERVRLLDVSQLCVFGNVQISTQTIRELAQRDVPVCYFTYGGWFTCYTAGLGHKNVELRIRQYEVAADSEKSIGLAKAFVIGKIRNTRTLLRRNHSAPPVASLRELSRLAGQAVNADSAESLLGIEGAAARIYFSQLPGMLKGSVDDDTFNFRNRNRRPPTDPVNAMLSFCYALLVKDLTVTLLSTGLDPYLGFYHRPRHGRPALALDLAEEFRPIVADSVVMTLINSGGVKAEDFIRRGDSVAMTTRGRKQTLAGYERRMDQLITHPAFGYSISYRRVLEVQARLLGRFITGEILSYPAFTTR